MNLHFRVLGSGKPLLIFHGLFGSSDNWQSISKEFAKQYQVFLIDLRNHGRSPHLSSHTYADMSADIESFMRLQGLDSAHFLGHSMGGKAVMQFAADNPQAVERLVVVDIAPRFYPIHHHSILQALQEVRLQELTNRDQAEQILAQHIKENDTRLFLMKNLYRPTPETFAWRMNLPVLTAQIGSIGEALNSPWPLNVPTLFLAGEKSDYIRPQDHDLIMEMFTNASLRTVANAGHWIHAEQPQLLLKEVLDFFDGK